MESNRWTSLQELFPFWCYYSPARSIDHRCWYSYCGPTFFHNDSQNTLKTRHASCTQKSNIRNNVKITLECEQTSQTANYKNIPNLYLVTYFTKVFCNLRLMGEKQVSTAERETRNSQVHASKNFLGLYSRSAQKSKTINERNNIQDEGITVYKRLDY